MTCKDCTHYDVCKNKEDYELVVFAIKELCPNFKDKSKIIELPCKVGDTVYCNGKYFAPHCEGQIHSFVVDDIITEVVRYHRGEIEYCFDFCDFGKTVFLTREEAEAKLKEKCDAEIH